MKHLMALRLTVIGLVLATTGIALGQIRPQGIVVSPTKPSLSLDLRLSKDCLSPNERLTLKFTLDRAAYVYIYNIDCKGNVWLLFPNGFSPNAWVNKGEHLLPDSDRYSIVIEGPPGVEYIQGIACLSPIPLLEYDPASRKTFLLLSTKPQALAKDLEAWLTKNLPQGSWATAWVEYGVSVGKLVISSWPPDAEVYVDGRFVGTTQRVSEQGLRIKELWLGSGYHQVQIAKKGFGSRSQTIYLKSCETRRLTFWLERPGTVWLVSQPRGAAIYVDGRYHGETPTEIELEPGLHLIDLRKPGYKTWSREIWIWSGQREEIQASLRVNLPPSARCRFAPAEPLVGEEVVFDASASYDPDGAISSYNWDFDDDGRPDAEGIKASRKFQFFGRHKVRLTVSDEDGGSDSITTVFRVRARPIAEFTLSPTGPFVGDQIRFDASSAHDPDGAIVAYEWDFGDGATATGRAVTRAYGAPGTYSVRLRVRDDDGLDASKTRSLTVVRGGKLTITSIPSGAKVYLDGNHLGATPLMTPKLVEGSYRVALKLDGYKDWGTAVMVPEQEEVAAALVPWGRLTVRSDPPGATVRVDGRPMGETVEDQGLLLYLEGEHRLEATRCGYKPWSQTVALASGEEKELRAKLERITELWIETDPPGAAIWFAGHYRGETPATLALEPASGELTLIKEGYTRWSTACVTEGKIHVPLRRNEPPVARISGPDRGTALAEMRFSAFGSTDRDGRIVGYRWEFGDGTTAAGESVWHRYEKPGTYRVVLTVVDDDGGEGGETKEVLIESRPPVARISGPTKGKVGEELTFRAEGSQDPDGEIVEYRWDFGDGKTASGMTASHRFEAPGTYKVVLMVADDCGVEASEALDVVVRTQLGLILDELQSLIQPVPFHLDLNAGRGQRGWSLGLLIGDNVRVGGSISFTGDEVPDYYEVPRQPWEGEVYSLGPELELGALLGTPFIAGIAIQAGIGISFQQRVHIATMPASQREPELLPQRAVVKPNGYKEWEAYLGTFCGISLRLPGAILSLHYHTRRGWIVGIGFEL